MSTTETTKRDLRRYWWGQTSSTFGSVFTAVAMPVIAVVYLDATPSQIALVSAAAFLPTLLLGLPAGALADRIVHPRRVLMALDTLSAVAVGAVALGVAANVASIRWLIALAAVQGCAGILMEVVYFIHLSQLTDATGIGPARARLQAGQYAAGFVGRVLVGPTVVVLGPAAALSVDVVSYLLSATALLSMSPAAPLRREAAGGFAKAVRETLRGMAGGLRFFSGDTFHRLLLVFLLVPGAAMAGASALTAPFVLRELKIPPGAYGLLFAGSGLLGLAGSVLAGRLLRPGRDARDITLASFAACVVCGLMLPLAGGPLWMAGACAALGISLPVFFGAIANVAIGPVIVTDVAEDAMGRTVALLKVLAAASGLFGALAGGALGDHVSARQAIWALDLGALLTIVLCLPAALRARRRARGASAPAPAPAEFTAAASGDR
jgi:MFS family permease